MSEINVEARDRYYAEVSLKLSKAGFAPQPQEDGYLPVDWNGSRLCRLTANGGVQYREEHIERSGGREALDRVIDIAGTTAEYMRCMESARNRQAETVGGGYTVLSEYNGVVFGAKAIKQFGCEFATWERTPDNKGVTIGHYIGDYKSAKQDFAMRARLIPREMVFTAEQLTDLFRCCKQALENPESHFTYDDEERIRVIQEQIECLSPGIQERTEALEAQAQEQQSQAQTMY